MSLEGNPAGFLTYPHGRSSSVSPVQCMLLAAWYGTDYTIIISRRRSVACKRASERARRTRRATDVRPSGYTHEQGMRVERGNPFGRLQLAYVACTSIIPDAHGPGYIVSVSAGPMYDQYIKLRRRESRYVHYLQEQASIARFEGREVEQASARDRATCCWSASTDRPPD